MGCSLVKMVNRLVIKRGSAWALSTTIRHQARTSLSFQPPHCDVHFSLTTRKQNFPFFLFYPLRSGDSDDVLFAVTSVSPFQFPFRFCFFVCRISAQLRYTLKVVLYSASGCVLLSVFIRLSYDNEAHCCHRSGNVGGGGWRTSCVSTFHDYWRFIGGSQFHLSLFGSSVVPSHWSLVETARDDVKVPITIALKQRNLDRLKVGLVPNFRIVQRFFFFFWSLLLISFYLNLSFLGVYRSLSDSRSLILRLIVESHVSFSYQWNSTAKTAEISSVI